MPLLLLCFVAVAESYAVSFAACDFRFVRLA